MDLCGFKVNLDYVSVPGHPELHCKKLTQNTNKQKIWQKIITCISLMDTCVSLRSLNVFIIASLKLLSCVSPILHFSGPPTVGLLGSSMSSMSRRHSAMDIVNCVSVLASRHLALKLL